MRWLRRVQGFVSGWRRFAREHYLVLAGPRRGPLERIAAPLGGYFADPFPCVHEGEPWLLMEHFLYSHNRGRLVARRLHGGPLIPIALEGSGHASFPCVFEDRGELFLLPETGASGTLDLYVCERFPERWRRVRYLARDLDAADTIPIRQDGRWWLVTSIRDARADGGRRRLAIFHTDDLRSGTLIAHPVNEEKRFHESPFSYGRNAGPIHCSSAGVLHRPIQASHRHYGEAVLWSRIDSLSASRFEETIPCPPTEGVGDLPDRPLHHIAVWGDWLACDSRDRVP